MRSRGTFPQYFFSGCAAISLNVVVISACTMSGEQAIHDAVDQESMLSADIVAENNVPVRDRTLPQPPPPSPPPPPMAVTQLGEQEFGVVGEVLVTGSMIAGAQAVGVPVHGVVPGSLSDAGNYALRYAYPQNTERYPDADPNPVKIAAREPVSTFSVDVDTTSYSNMRRFLEDGVLPPSDSVRIEEVINYFNYSYEVPTDRTQPFQPTLAVYPTPWNAETQILHVGIKGFDVPRAERPNANLVFLIDTSGSMGSTDKLPLLKRSFRMLVDQLEPEDKVSMVVYAGSAGVVLEPTPGSEKAKILAALDRLHAGGSTAGGEGVRQAYQLAKANFDEDGVNRVILATDGDFNVGITDPDALEDFVERERESGVFLTVLGFGGGNYNDVLMQKLSQAGNGTAAYIDNLSEARKVFVGQISGTLFTIAKDVKIQTEFNPACIAEYRLIGYETRILDETDFNNDAVDAGAIGSGHTVTALYEITPVGSSAHLADPLRYGGPQVTGDPSADPSGELAFVKIRYKLPNEDVLNLITRAVTDNDVRPNFAALPVDMRFAAAVAGVGHLIRNDPYVKSMDYDDAIALANAARGGDEYGYRAEFVQLLRLAKSAESMQALNRQ